MARMKELAEENLVWLVVAKVEYMVVEMVEKVVVDMGYLMEREEEDGGEDGVVVVVVVVGMKEGMEERMMVEFVVEMVVELEGGWPAKEATMAAFCCLALCWLLAGKRGKGK